MRLSELAVEGHQDQYLVEVDPGIRILFTPKSHIQGVYLDGTFFNLEFEHEGLGEAAANHFTKKYQKDVTNILLLEILKSDMAYKTGYEDGKKDQIAEQLAAEKARESALAQQAERRRVKALTQKKISAAKKVK